MDERGPAFARGFPVGFYDLRRDGLRTYSWSVREPVAVDRIQYLRGPAAVLYGDGSPGALINMVLKKPLPVPRYEFGASGGSSGFGRLTADLTGPLTASRRVRYRVVAASEWLESGFDNDERRLTLLPTIAIDVGARGTLVFDTEWYDQRGRDYWHQVPATADAQRGDFSGFPWDLSINSPDYRLDRKQRLARTASGSPAGRTELAARRRALHQDRWRHRRSGSGRAGGRWPHRPALPVSRSQYLERIPDRHVCRDQRSNRPCRPSARGRRGSGFEHGRH